jgi:hypothetical protein
VPKADSCTAANNIGTGDYNGRQLRLRHVFMGTRTLAAHLYVQMGLKLEVE